MRKILLALLGLFAAVGINSAVGATLACAVGFAPLAGVAAVNGAALVSGLCGGFTPSGALGAGIYTEVWTGELIKAFRSAAESIGWYAIRSYDAYVKHDVIHFGRGGRRPEILGETIRLTR